LSTTNPTWTDPGSNPELRSERPATNRLSHGTTLIFTLANNFLKVVIIMMIKSRRMRRVGHVFVRGKKRNLYASFTEKPKGKRPLETMRRKLEDNIKTDHKEM
jgi:hypothetical protein